MNKILLLLCSTFFPFLYGAENAPLKPISGTLKWFEWVIKQSTQDTFRYDGINRDIDEYITSLERAIATMEERLEHSSIAIEELNNTDMLYISNAVLAGLGVCIMFACKENICPPCTSLIKKIGFYALFLNLMLDGISHVSGHCDVLQQKQNYSTKLQAELDINKRLLVSLKLLKIKRRLVIVHLTLLTCSENLDEEIT